MADTFVSPSFEAFVETYTPRIQRYATRIGIPFDKIDDCVSTIMTYLLERDFLGAYDATRGSFEQYAGHMIKIRTQYFQRCDLQQGEKEFTEPKVFASASEDHGRRFGETDRALERAELADQVDLATIIQEVYADLQSLKATSTMDLSRLWMDVVNQVAKYGKFSYQKLAEERAAAGEKRLSRQAYEYQMKRLREVASVQRLKSRLLVAVT